MFYNVQEQEDFEFTYTSESEWDRADAAERGYNNPESEWVLSGRDVWHKNPYFTGTPSGRHPEDDSDLRDEENQALLAELDDIPF